MLPAKSVIISSSNNLYNLINHKQITKSGLFLRFIRITYVKS